MITFSTLSKRENQVVNYVVHGLSNKQIARAICISTRTVEDHRAAAMKKLNVHNSVELTRKMYGIRSDQ